jgi:multicomponent Na+:H+ antiporter subunit D
VTGFATQAPHGVAGATLHLLNHGLFKALLFLCAGAIVHETGLTNLSELGGLARRRPFITAAFTVGSLAIAGVPPLNGYASLGLIHEALTGEPPVYALALVAQALTVAVLARACYLGFYRRRDEEYEQSETPAAGMRISLIALATGCVAFGVFASALVRRVAGPAASSLLHPQRYASAVLSVGGSLPRPDVTFDYGKTTDLITTAAELVAGGLVAWWVVRRGTPAPIAWLRKLHTGSVNDYAAMLAAGLVTALVVVAA